MAAIIVAATSVVGIVGTLIAEGQYAAQAVVAQRVIVDKTASDLFGDGGQQVISQPEPLIIDDPKAFLPGTGEKGARLVDENYLKAHNIYPRQLRTVTFTLGLVRLGSIAALVVSVLVILALRKK